MTGWSASDSSRMLARRYHDERCQKRLAAASASACVASSRSSSAAHDGTSGGVGQSAWMSRAVERLGARPHRLRAEAERLALVVVSPSDGAVAREDGQDRDVLAELAQAGDEAAAGEGDVVRMGRDEDVGHGRPSIPSGHRPAAAAAQSVEAARADERHEDAVAVGSFEPLVAVPRDDREHLAIARPDRDDEAAAIGELVAQRLRDGRRRRGDDDPVPRRAGRIAQAAVGHADLDRAGEVRAPGLEPLARERDQRRLPLDRGDVGAEPGKDRGLVAGPGADLEDPVAWL